jgi:hypothetical protein
MVLTWDIRHFKRVVGYARTSDYVTGGLAAAFGPAALYTLEKFSPSHVGKGGFAKIMRLTGAVGLIGGFLVFYQRSSRMFYTSSPTSICAGRLSWTLTLMCDFIVRVYGATENAREVEMDMREMVSKVKKGEPLYGVSELTPHMQGVAARQSRYSALFFGVMPWFNFVNHNQHGVDTAKYYQQAERELEAEKSA